MRHSKIHRAFTLIELLIVVAIIIALLAILMPAMNRAIEVTNRAVCASQLSQMATGTISYASDNFGRMPGMVHQWSGMAYPDYMRITNTGSGEWNAETMNEYTNAFDIDPADALNGQVKGIAMCPSVDADLMMRFITEANLPNAGSWNFIEYQYTYWGGVDRVVNEKPWQLRGEAATQLVESRADSGRVLLTDVINFDWSDQAWRYNHGTNGWAFNERAYMPWDRDPVANITGINTAFGDASVRWKDRGNFEFLDSMNLPATYLGGAVVGSNSNGDAFYY